MADERYTSTELMICLASRTMADNATAFIGTGIPMLAASLAQKMHAKNLTPVFEFGGTGAILEKLPLAVGDMRTYNKGLHAAGICSTMEAAQRGFIEYGFLGGAQIDAYGNLNSTVIGEQPSPKVRLPGSGGGNDVGSACWRTIVIMRQSPRTFVPEVDFLTTPGYLDGPGARERAGLPANTGPYRVVTDLCTLDFEDEEQADEPAGAQSGGRARAGTKPPPASSYSCQTRSAAMRNPAPKSYASCAMRSTRIASTSDAVPDSRQGNIASRYGDRLRTRSLPGSGRWRLVLRAAELKIRSRLIPDRVQNSGYYEDVIEAETGPVPHVLDKSNDSDTNTATAQTQSH